MAGLNNVYGIDKVFSNGATNNETYLVGMDKEVNKVMQPKGETFGVYFETTVLMRDRSKVVQPIGPCFYGEKDNIGLIDGPEV
jgi:hypothetical protein